MKNQLLQTNPLVFECDTTFGTLAEGYKLYLPAFHSKFTNKWEIGGLLFLSTETKEKVEVGLKYFKESLPYQVVDGVTKFIFFMDKDFDYIQVLSYDCNHCEYRTFCSIGLSLRLRKYMRQRSLIVTNVTIGKLSSIGLLLI